MAVNVVGEGRRPDVYEMSEMVPHINRSAIIGATFTILGAGGLFHLFANAIGLSAVNFIKGGVGGGTQFFTFIYYLVTMSAAYFLGGIVASRLINDRASRTVRSLHAVVAWSISGCLAMTFGAVTSSSINHTLFGYGTNALNWLLLLVSVLGCSACVGGTLSAKAIRKLLPSKERYRSAA